MNRRCDLKVVDGVKKKDSVYANYVQINMGSGVRKAMIEVEVRRYVRLNLLFQSRELSKN